VGQGNTAPHGRDAVPTEMLKDWRSLLVLINVVLFLAFNPFERPFQNLLSPPISLVSI
jgi:hypothetical protein